tara:strand:+ start:37582 stop:38028 length:447 start_codon:yes stop_codon:yes gene_type:complete
MPDAAQTFVDTVILISATLPATYDESGYDALADFTAIGQVTDWTPGGKTFNITTSNPIAQRGTDKYKGTYNNDADSLTMNRDDDDAGQVKCLAALASDLAVSFQVIYQDATEDFFTGKVVSFNTTAGGADAIVQAVLQVERVSDTVVS